MSMEDEAIYELKTLFDGDLEKVARCPVCLQLPVGPVLVCKKGHQLCRHCRRQVKKCPICKSRRFSDKRNLVVEELNSGIKSIMVRSLSVQSEPPAAAPQNIGPPMCCRIGECHFTSTPELLFMHVIEKHNNSLLKIDIVGKARKRWLARVKNLDYNCRLKYTGAFAIQSLSLFFVTVRVNRDGDLLVSIESASFPKGNPWQYNIKLLLPNRRYTLQHLRVGLVQACQFRDDKYTNAAIYSKDMFCDLQNSFKLEIYIPDPHC